jgi:hypothetical protein
MTHCQWASPECVRVCRAGFLQYVVESMAPLLSFCDGNSIELGLSKLVTITLPFSLIASSGST